jgi:hypothetical protein
MARSACAADRAVHTPRSGADKYWPSSVVRSQELLVGRSRRQAQTVLACQTGVLDALPEHCVLLHREAVPGRQRQDVVVGVEDLHRSRGEVETREE